MSIHAQAVEAAKAAIRADQLVRWGASVTAEALGQLLADGEIRADRALSFILHEAVGLAKSPGDWTEWVLKATLPLADLAEAIITSSNPRYRWGLRDRDNVVAELAAIHPKLTGTLLLRFPRLFPKILLEDKTLWDLCPWLTPEVLQGRSRKTLVAALSKRAATGDAHGFVRLHQMGEDVSVRVNRAFSKPATPKGIAAMLFVIGFHNRRIMSHEEHPALEGYYGEYIPPVAGPYVARLIESMGDEWPLPSSSREETEQLSNFCAVAAALMSKDIKLAFECVKRSGKQKAASLMLSVLRLERVDNVDSGIVEWVADLAHSNPSLLAEKAQLVLVSWGKMTREEQVALNGFELDSEGNLEAWLPLTATDGMVADRVISLSEGDLSPEALSIDIAAPRKGECWVAFDQPSPVHGIWIRVKLGPKSYYFAVIRKDGGRALVARSAVLTGEIRRFDGEGEPGES